MNDSNLLRLKQLEIDVWDRRRQRLKKIYIKFGLSEEEAERLSDAEVSRQIREAP